MKPVDTSSAAVPSPSFVLDEALLLQNLDLISATARKADVEIIPALKGFALWRVFPLLAEHIKGAAASSLNEARLIAEEMGRPCYTYAPVYPGTEFKRLLSLSSHITFNSAGQVRRFLPDLKGYNKDTWNRVSWGVRVNPDWSPVKTALYNPASPESRLGMPREELDDLLSDFCPEGLHVHALCESSAQNSAGLIEAVQERYGDLFPRLSWLNLGGGHLLTRKGYDLELLVRSLRKLKNEFPNLTVILEPGSAFAWETGYLKATVQDIVRRGGVSTVLLDVSFTAHMPDCLEMPYQPRIRGARIAEPGDKSCCRYRMGGNSCLAGDVMGDWIFDEPLTVGDDIIFEDMIHYTMVKTNMFNGVAHPSIGIIRRDGSFELVREFGYGDYRNRLS
ncbi:carboxynorspermidine decarboxylase [Marispirochaeta sp.]|uniref:carboxynorspermidine decarboxylase n=1 Tax=Marispirochaeta sp. TaxID=2038653 RepID=UPI0029C9A85E|nr:carboxynorspermidine decarboxylase [Marispirochaeta sp.]